MKGYGRIRMGSSCGGWIALAILAWGGQAFAVDGVKLIGRKAAYPIVISQSGSYKLKASITVPDADTTAILIKDTATDVTLDLNGFTISGPTDCPGVPGDPCSPTGSGVGIATECSGPCPLQGTLVIHNGTVRSMGADGINVRVAQVRIEKVSLQDNGRHGLHATGSVLVKDCFANTNGKFGFAITDPGIITGSIALANGETGIDLRGQDSGFVSADNVAAYNLYHGVEAYDAPLVQRSSVMSRNGETGLAVSGGANVIQGNVMSGNTYNGITSDKSVITGNSLHDNQALGLETELSLVAHNLATQNALEGMRLGESGFSTNVLRFNNGGLGELLYGVELGSNLCGGDMSCP